MPRTAIRHIPDYRPLATDRASFGVFGTFFVYTNAGFGWLQEYFAQWQPIQRQIITDMRWAEDRQKRPSICYWDVLTWLTPPKRPVLFGNPDVPELGLLDRLASSLGRGRLDGEEIQELAELGSIRYVTSRYRWWDAETNINADLASIRANPRRFTKDKSGDLQIVRPGMFRTFELHMGDAGGSLKDTVWQRLLVLSLLIQIRVDLETYYESGHMRLARCARRSCRAWFIRNPMGQKQRFCSDVCRATGFRDARTKEGSKRTQKHRSQT